MEPCKFGTAPAPAAICISQKKLSTPAPAPSKMLGGSGSSSGSGQSVPVPAAPAPAPAPNPCYIAIQELFTGSVLHSVPCSRPGQHLLSNTVRRIAALVNIAFFNYCSTSPSRTCLRAVLALCRVRGCPTQFDLHAHGAIKQLRTVFVRSIQLR